MEIKIKTTNLELTTAIDDFAREKVLSLEKFIRNADGALCEIELAHQTHQGNAFYAELNLTADKTLYRATAEDTDLYKAIDIAKDEMKRELRKASSKKDTLLRKGQRRIKEMFGGN